MLAGPVKLDQLFLNEAVPLTRLQQLCLAGSVVSVFVAAEVRT